MPPVPLARSAPPRKVGQETLPAGERAYGRVAQLSLQSCGTEVDATVVVVQQDGDVIFEGKVNHGDVITFTGTGKDNEMSPEIAILVNDEVNGGFITNGSKPIGPGLKSGDFLITEGWTRRGNELSNWPRLRWTPKSSSRPAWLLNGSSSWCARHQARSSADASCSGTDSILVEVITASKSRRNCMDLVNSSTISDKEKRPLIQALKHAASEFDKGKFKQGIEKLEGFIKKVESRPDDKIPPATKAQFVACAQFIIDALTP